MSSRKNPVLMYHDVYPKGKGEGSIYALDPSVLKRHLEVIKASGRSSTTADRVESISVPSVVLTFDDGRRGVVEYALPLLAEAGIRATLFMTASLIGSSGWCARQDLVTWVAGGSEIGAHGWTHRSLTAVSRDEAMQEIMRSKSALEDLIGRAVVSMSFPNGRLSAGLVRAAQEAGLKYLFGSWPGYGTGVRGVYGRFAIVDRTSDWVFHQIIHGRGGLAYAPQRGLFVLGRVVGETTYSRVHALFRGN